MVEPTRACLPRRPAVRIRQRRQRWSIGLRVVVRSAPVRGYDSANSRSARCSSEGAAEGVKGIVRAARKIGVELVRWRTVCPALNPAGLVAYGCGLPDHPK